MRTNSEINIERYITEKMSNEESKDFEARLESDSDLAEEYKSSLLAHQLIKEAGRLEMKNDLESFDNEMARRTTDKKVIPLWVKRSIPIAALLVIFFGVYQFTILNRSMSTAEVFDEYYEVYSDPSIVRNSDNGSQNNWEQASTYYHQRNFKEAIVYFERSKKEVPSYLADFYLGVSLLSQDVQNNERAIARFDEVLKVDNDYHQQALWFKGLALLKSKRSNEALEIFKNLAETNGYNHVKAKEIIDLNIKD